MARPKRGSPTIAVGYVRASTERREGGPEAQRDELARWAEWHAITLASIHEDALSGGTEIEDRPSLLAALKAVRTQRAGLLVVMRVVEKVIFDEPVAVEVPRRLGAGRGESPAVVDEGAPLAVEARGRAGNRIRRSLARGDIAALLDALLRKLGEGLELASAADSAPAAEGVADRKGEEEAEPPPPAPRVDTERLARLCRSKVKRVAARMTAQIDRVANEREDLEGAIRVIVQLAAVLGILWRLRLLEQQPHWRWSGHRLFDEDSLDALFTRITRASRHVGWPFRACR
jgi:hypothetical protein